MTKTLKCADLMPGCDFQAKGETTEEILQAAAAHAKEVHGLEVNDDLVAKVKSVIKDD